MNDKELKELIGSLAIAQRETERQLKKTDIQMQETDKQMQETDKRIERMSDKIDKLGDIYGGLANNIGASVEEFFYHGFKDNPNFAGIHFEDVKQHIKTRDCEYDIVLYNRDSVVVIEVKHKFHPKEIEEFVKDNVLKFKKEFQQYKSYKLYAGVAGFVIPEETQKLAIKNGFFVFTQSGENIKILNNKDFVAKIY